MGRELRGKIAGRQKAFVHYSVYVAKESYKIDYNYYYYCSSFFPSFFLS
jgi:hypothetical protein